MHPRGFLLWKGIFSMKRTLIFFFSLTVIMVIAGEYGKYETREEAIAAHKRNVEKVGGLVERPAEGPYVLFLNEQTRLPDSCFREQVADVTQKSRILNVVQTGTKLPQPSVLHTNYLSDVEVAAIICVCDLPGVPAMTVYPELRSAVINVDALYTNDVALLSERVRKELWRGFAFVFGGSYTLTYPKAALRPIGASMRELDKLVCHGLSIDTMQPMRKVMERWGMVPITKTSYKRACEEGWAPAPTNDVQKALWDSVKVNAATNTPIAN